jgi:hypothetical protein
VRDIKKIRGAMGYTANGELIAMLPQAVAYNFFKNRLRFLEPKVTRRQINETCREWFYNEPLSIDSVFLFFMECCAHEFAHFKLNHNERNISRKQAESEAREFADRYAEFLFRYSDSKR